MLGCCWHDHLVPACYYRPVREELVLNIARFNINFFAPSEPLIPMAEPRPAQPPLEQIGVVSTPSTDPQPERSTTMDKKGIEEFIGRNLRSACLTPIALSAFNGSTSLATSDIASSLKRTLRNSSIHPRVRVCRSPNAREGSSFCRWLMDLGKCFPSSLSVLDFESHVLAIEKPYRRITLRP